MGYYRDLREYLDALECAGKLRCVHREINKDTELHPLVKWQFRGLDEDQRTGWLFDNLTDLAGRHYEARVASAVLAPSRSVYAMGLQCRPEEIWERWEALPRMTALCWHTRDIETDTGTINVGIYNGVPMSPTRTTCRLQHGAQMRLHVQKARARGEPLQAAVVVGAVPVIGMTASAKAPYGLSELALAGGLAREPIPVVRCETVDLVVPATAEIVLEGELDVTQVEPDPPSGEHTGYMIVGAEVFAFHVKCITHRRNPIWHDF